MGGRKWHSHLPCPMVDDQLLGCSIKPRIASRDTVKHFHCCYELRYKMRFICNNLIEKIESWGMDVPESLSSQPGVTRGCESHSKGLVGVGRGEKKKKKL